MAYRVALSAQRSEPHELGWLGHAVLLDGFDSGPEVES